MDATANEVKGLHSILEHDGSTYPARAVDFALESTGVITSMNGIMSTYIDADLSAGVYGKTPTTNKTDYAGYFTGHFLAKALSTSENIPTTTENLVISQSKIEGLHFSVSQTIPANAIDWQEGLIANIEIDNNPRNVTFINPPFESGHLILKVTHSGTGTLTFNTPIHWQNGIVPEFTATVGAEDLILINYHKLANGTGIYYASVAYNFIKPE